MIAQRLFNPILGLPGQAEIIQSSAILRVSKLLHHPDDEIDLPGQFGAMLTKETMSHQQDTLKKRTIFVAGLGQQVGDLLAILHGTLSSFMHSSMMSLFYWIIR